MILFDLHMILICHLFHLNNHFFLLLFCFDLLFHCHLHFHFHNLHLHFHIYQVHFHNFHFLDFLMFCQLKLYLINHQINLIIFYIQGYAFYTLLFLLFFSFNAFKAFLASISLIVFFLILLTKFSMSIYFNLPNKYLN